MILLENNASAHVAEALSVCVKRMKFIGDETKSLTVIRKYDIIFS